MSAPGQPHVPPHRRRRRRALSVALSIGIVVAELLLAVIGFVAFVLATEPGTRFALEQAGKLSDGMVRVGTAHGHLLGDVELREVRYAGHDGTVVTIERLHLRYVVRELLLRRLHLRALEVEGLVVQPGAAQPPREPRPPATLPARLPLAVVVDALALDGFALHPAGRPEAPPFTIEHATLAGQWLGDRVEIRELTTGFAWSGPLRAQARARMASDHIDIEDLLLQGPGEVRAQGRFGIEAASSALAIAFENLRWPFVAHGKTPPAVDAVTGELKVDGRLDDYRYALAASAALQGRAAKLVANGSGSLAAAHVETLRLETVPAAAGGSGKPKQPAPRPSAIDAHGDVAWSPQFTAGLQVVLDHVDPALFVADLPGDLNGRLDTRTTLVGEQPDVAFTADLADSTLRGQAFALKAEGHADPRRAQLNRLLLTAGRGRVQAQGEVAWLPRLAVNADATITKLDPALFVAGWPGDINGSVAVKTADEAKAPIRFDARIADSRLRSYPLRLSAQGAVAGTLVTLAQLDLASGATRLSAQGQVTPPFALSGSFDSPDLGALLPKLGGRAAFTFRLEGTVEQPHLVSEGDASALHYGEQRIAKLHWTADVDPMLDSKVELTLANADVGLHVERASLRMTGLEIYHRAELHAETERGTAELAFQGGYDRKRGEWGGDLAVLKLAPSGLSQWSLDKSAGILIGSKRRALETACLQGAEGHACFNLEQNVISDGTRVGWNIDRLALSVLQPLLPPDYRLDGSIDGEGHVNFTGGDVADALASLNLRAARLQVPDAPPLQIDSGSLRADQRNDILHAVAALNTAQGALTADVSAAPAARFDERALSGALTLDFPSLAFLAPLLPQFSALDGRLGGRLALAGTPHRPQFIGEVRLDQAHAKLVQPGIELKDVQLRLAADGQGPIALDGALQSGGGSLRISGKLDPFAQPLFADIAFDGEDVQVMNTAQARAWASPKLRLVRDAKGATLSGELSVPRADITPKGFGGGGIDASADQVLVGVERPPPAATLPVYADLRLVLGDAVRIEGYGLKTRIEGAVNVTQEPLRGARGRGELRLVEGRYKAYGQDLKIEDGRLLFTGGAVTAPAVDIYATRRPREDITVGVRVRGTLAKPELTVQSSPPLPREQQLSWLILGRSLETSSTQDRSLVSSAALSLGLGGGDYLAGLIGKRVGLDQLSVGSTVGSGSEVAASSQSIAGAQGGSYASSAAANAQIAQLTLGKYLTPKLFVSYGVSLFQQGYTVRLLYSLGHGFKLSTESGTASGGDIIYTTERGKRKKPAVPAAPTLGPVTTTPAPDTGPGTGAGLDSGPDPGTGSGPGSSPETPGQER